MTLSRKIMTTACAWVLVVGGTNAQEREDRTLLSWEQMRAIVNEASGERAMHHVLELVPYPRVRAVSEYQGHFRESEVMAKFASEYGYRDVEIESFPGQQRLWQPSRGELWMLEPEIRKLYDIYDVAVSLAANSDSGEVAAELVDVGIGARNEDYANKSVEGKIILGSATPSNLQRLGIFERGAAGIVSYNSIRSDYYPDEILSQGLSANPPEGKRVGFGWCIAPRVARELSGMLGRGEKVVLKSVIKTDWFPGELEVVHATIPGDGSTDQAIAVSAHLYEGYLKQGANDDASGCAMTLEMGRAYLQLVKKGELPPPRRTIHFVWVPEISGTNAWLNKHEDIKKKLISDLNFDMVGFRLSSSGSFLVMHRMPDTFPSFLSDLTASILEFVANVNVERVRYRANGYRFSLPVVSPNGSQDPFYVTIDKYYGASDHAIYLQHGIPAVDFTTWPDMWYHSSQDTPDKLDPTQLKRAAVVGVAAMSTLASADDEKALKIAGESLSRGSIRMSEAQKKGLSYLADASKAADLLQAYKEARNAVRHQAEIEKAVVRSLDVLFNTPEAGRQRLASWEKLIEQRASVLENEVEAYYRTRAEQKQVKPMKPEFTTEEKDAAKTIAERMPSQAGRFAGGRGQAAAASTKLTEEEQAALRKIPQHMTSELNALIGKKKSVLEIRDFLSAEFEPLSLSGLMEYLRAQEKLGTVKLSRH